MAKKAHLGAELTWVHATPWSFQSETFGSLYNLRRPQ